MANPDTILPVDHLYRGRESFTIIGLTGLAGSGCSTLSTLMSLPKEDLLAQTRKISEIPLTEAPEVDNNKNYQNDKVGVNNKALGSLVFKRKYAICHNFVQENYKPYIVIKYTHILWLYMLLLIKKEASALNPEVVINKLTDFLVDKYKPSVYSRDDDYKQRIRYAEESRRV